MRLERITYGKVQEYLKHSDMIVIPVGSTENHGKHMPLGTDTLIPNRIIELLEEKNDVLVAPTIPYGATDYLTGFPGTVSIGVDGLTMILNRVTECLRRYGFRKFVILNGHGGNNKSIENAGLNLYKEGCLLADLNWWSMAGELNPAWKGGHGGGEETAAIMGIDPSLVDMDQIHEPMKLKDDISPLMKTTGWSTVDYKGATVIIPREMYHYSDNGWYGKDAPDTASEEWGKEMLQAFADWMDDFLKAFAEVQLPEAES
ncbi:MAG: creatininase family protein [Bulleidia sp.]|nr:creatininase family protein [Bulleidia sp.]